MSINWEKLDTLILLNVRGTRLDLKVEALKPIKNLIDASVEQMKIKNSEHNLEIDRVYINANALVFEQLIDFLSDPHCVPPNPNDRFYLRRLAKSYGLNDLVKRIDDGKHPQTIL